MYLTTHAAAGVVISQHIDNPLPVLLYAFLSHFVLDFIPHGDDNVEDWARAKKSRVALVAGLDVGLLTVMIITLYSSDRLGLNRDLASAGIIGAILPDVLTFVYPAIHEKLNWFFLVRWIKKSFHVTRISPILGFLNRRQDHLHFFIHNLPERNLTWTQGLVFQAVLLTLFLFVGFRFR